MPAATAQPSAGTSIYARAGGAHQPASQRPPRARVTLAWAGGGTAGRWLWAVVAWLGLLFEFESRTSWGAQPGRVGSWEPAPLASRSRPRPGPHLLIPKQIPPSVSTRRKGSPKASSVLFCLRPPLTSAFPRPQRLSPPRPCSHPRTPRRPNRLPACLRARREGTRGSFDHDRRRRHGLAEEDHAEIQVRAEPDFEAPPRGGVVCFRVS